MEMVNILVENVNRREQLNFSQVADATRLGIFRPLLQYFFKTSFFFSNFCKTSA